MNLYITLFKKTVKNHEQKCSFNNWIDFTIQKLKFYIIKWNKSLIILFFYEQKKFVVELLINYTNILKFLYKKNVQNFFNIKNK